LALLILFKRKKNKNSLFVLLCFAFFPSFSFFFSVFSHLSFSMRLTTLHDLVSGCITAEDFDWRLQHACLSMFESRVEGASLVSTLDIDNIVVWSSADLRNLCSGIFHIGCETAITFVFRQCLLPAQPKGLSFLFPLFKRGAEMFSLRVKVSSMTTLQ